jgi:hypothetical protein
VTCGKALAKFFIVILYVVSAAVPTIGNTPSVETTPEPVEGKSPIFTFAIAFYYNYVV